MKKLLFLTACICAIIFGACGSASKTPGDAVKNIIELQKAGDWDAIVEEIAFPEDADPAEVAQFKEGYAQMGREKAAPQMEAKGGIASYEITEETIAEDGQTAEVKATITYGNGSTDDQKMSLKLVNGEWKVSLDK